VCNERSAKHGKRVQAQGGRKTTVSSRSADLDFARKTVSSGFACGGERCLNDVVVVEEAVYDEFTERVLESAREQTVG